MLVFLPPNPAAGAGTGAVAGAGAIAGGPLLSCHPPTAPHATVRVRRNTAPRRADLQQVVGLRRLRRHRDHTVPVQLLHLLLLLGERFLEALFLSLVAWPYIVPDTLSFSASVNRTKMHIVCGRQTVDPPTSAIIVMFVVVVVLGGVAWC